MLISINANAVDWNKKAVDFCDRFKAYGKHNGKLFCKATGKFQIEPCPNDAEDNLRHGFDGRSICMNAIKDCFKWAKNQKCLTGKFYECDSHRENKCPYPSTANQLITDMVSTIGFAPTYVTSRFEQIGKYYWRPEKMRKKSKHFIKTETRDRELTIVIDKSIYKVR